MKAPLHANPRTDKPKVKKVGKLVKDADLDLNITALKDSKRAVKFASDLEGRCEAALKGSYSGQEDGEILPAPC